MTLRKLPDLNDAEAMAALGRLHALRNARLDAVHALRDAVVRMQSGQFDDAAEIDAAHEALSRLEVIREIERVGAKKGV